ncbi:hypothetical protein CHISP_2382 [Chitinispirillum alkaliphilum]|nr:hypothetical protein CHISP_2382 [Chitinispirillum alkaliphilum]
MPKQCNFKPASNWWQSLFIQRLKNRSIAKLFSEQNEDHADRSGEFQQPSFLYS